MPTDDAPPPVNPPLAAARHCSGPYRWDRDRQTDRQADAPCARTADRPCSAYYADSVKNSPVRHTRIAIPVIGLLIEAVNCAQCCTVAYAEACNAGTKRVAR